jgi:alkylation response protein AidB-like acyl-CoA dehydrogenase
MEVPPLGDRALTIGAWTQTQDFSAGGDPTRAAQFAHQLLDLGLLALPLPGDGETPERFRALIALGVADCVLARLAEGHADAISILAELQGPDPGPGRFWGVWAAQPPGRAGLEAHRTEEGWRLEGEKPYCSGAAACDSALVTATTSSGSQLLAVDLHQEGVEALDGTWPALGMAGSDSRTVRFRHSAATAVGAPGAYVDRPGFWHGATGVAACWMGGAVGVAGALIRAAARRELDPHALAHLGAIDGAIAAMRSVLLEAARDFDLDPEDRQGRAALVARRTRTVVEWGTGLVLERVGRALGAGPLTQDAAHSRRVADLTVYLRQSHAERDLLDHGKRLLEVGVDW